MGRTEIWVGAPKQQNPKNMKGNSYSKSQDSAFSWRGRTI